MRGMSVRGFRTLAAAIALLLPAWSAPAEGGEAGILAGRILVAECGGCLVFDPERRRGLAAEIDRAWGDCPSGCLHRETAFFTVTGDKGSEAEPATARRMPGFEQAMRYAGSGAFGQAR